MDQCKWAYVSTPAAVPFERGEIKALSGEGSSPPAIAAGWGRLGPGDEARADGRRSGGEARAFRRNALKIGGCPDFIKYAGEKLQEGRASKSAPMPWMPAGSSTIRRSARPQGRNRTRLRFRR
ncbi:MAG: hypothetical protein LBU32_26395 [Clostridiales bacterium]|nr:hypothetical protein [Clostridiales bacterium]